MNASDTLTPPEMEFTEEIIEFLKKLPKEKRSTVVGNILDYFCELCGDYNKDGLRCQCWNDE